MTYNHLPISEGFSTFAEAQEALRKRFLASERSDKAVICIEEFKTAKEKYYIALKLS